MGNSQNPSAPRPRPEPPRRRRADHEPPSAMSVRGWHFHHVGIPTTEPRRGEVYLPHLKIHVCGFETSPFGIEWMRFEPGAKVSELVRTVPHVAFEVDDLDAALKALRATAEITSPSKGVRVAMIIDNGAPVELIEFRKNRGRPWRGQKPQRLSKGTSRGRAPGGRSG